MLTSTVRHLRWIWKDMLSRCYDPTDAGYHNYGGKGIEVCERWKVFHSFLRDNYDKWFEGASLDRKASDGNYEPDNCQWIERRFQTIVGKVAPRKDLNRTGVPGVDEIKPGYYRVLVKEQGRNGPKKTLYSGRDFAKACQVRKDWEERRKAYWREQGAPI